jgi:hypothetical protein
MAYFTISHELRGCFMSDFSYVVRASTRRELKAAIAAEASDLRDAGFIVLNSRAVASLAAAAWRARKRNAEIGIPYRLGGQNGWPYTLGVTTGTTREEWMQQNAYDL